LFFSRKERPRLLFSVVKSLAVKSLAAVVPRREEEEENDSATPIVVPKI